MFTVHWGEWLMPFIALVFFALFGLTPEARSGYCRVIRRLCTPFFSPQANSKEEELAEAVFKSGRDSEINTPSG